jgi:hypothetical protein
MAARDDAFGGGVSLAARTRGWFTKLLDGEVQAVEAKKTSVLVLSPGRADVAAIRADGTEEERAPLVAATAYDSVRALLEDDPAAAAVAAPLSEPR